ncbi:type IV secretion system protein VirB10 [Phenylobacterium sp.]|uniref:type IV secretion system protein VirB10 n=1 Tax=Phenylobacterium sp. TaxID=1871053 RepID=UPI002DE977DC|nr:type IV secretion system protein VirB10 [Phenylobacterium sp.]
MTDPTAQSRVFDRDGARPRVSQPSSPLTLAAGLGAAGLMGLVVFAVLSHGRQAHAQASPPAPVAYLPAATPALNSVPATPPAPLMQPLPEPAAPSPSPYAVQADAQDLHAPTMVVDLAEPAAATTAARIAGPPAARPADPGALSAEERFAARVAGASVDVARATRLRDPSRTIPQGAVVPAVLETAINSDLPGSVRAVVSRDVRSFDGRQVLIPRGSRLVGQYKSAVAVGQTRAFVIWSRVLTPDGISVDIASPGADSLGRGGLDGETDDHFLRRFGAAVLLTVVDTAAAVAANGHSGGNTFVIGSPVQANRVAEIALQKQIDIPATIKVAQGTPLQVFVARDLDFSGVAP